MLAFPTSNEARAVADSDTVAKRLENSKEFSNVQTQLSKCNSIVIFTAARPRAGTRSRIPCRAARRPRAATPHAAGITHN